MCNKRGVGAIIAWVLLLGFTVALATMIFLWMQGQTETMSESTVDYVEGELQCQSVRINVIKKGVDPNPCTSFEVQNVGYLNIDSVAVREFCTDGTAKSGNPIKIDPALEPKSSKTESTDGYKETVSDKGGYGICQSISENTCPQCIKVEVMPVIKTSETTKKLTGCKDRTIVVEC